MYKTKTLLGLAILAVSSSLSSNAFAYGSYSMWSSGTYEKCTSGCTDSNYDSKYDSGTGWEYNYDSNDTSKDVKLSAWSDYGYSGKLQKEEVYKDSYNRYGTKHGSDSYYDKIDNRNGKMESVLFDYGDDCVVLEDITINKRYGDDADIKIMAFIGDKKNTTDGKIDIGGMKYDDFDQYIASKSYSELMNDGNWKSYNTNVDKYSNTGDYKNNFVGYTKDDNGNYVKDYTASSYWLVMADASKDGYTDYFKVKNMGGYYYDSQYGGCQKIEIKCDGHKPPQVPAPGTLVLLALGLGVLRLRKS
jgi:hypothetical protein